MAKILDPTLMELILTQQKTCSRCKRLKSPTQFYTKGQRLSSQCKACELKTKRERKKQKRRQQMARTTRRTIDLSKTFKVVAGVPAERSTVQQTIKELCEWTLGKEKQYGKDQ
ncbi:MAG: hypothetical protein COT74_01940 [Bdellovibrionales bacterium CG10_big_fil_rev_8_21_14_0_10_45_34]|nr:MAG: hypothetical protein COT74_01940 [Bdellovibrionales bacterium CG10_big_fil_rev_8_21_14_0_10_45_34]